MVFIIFYSLPKGEVTLYSSSSSRLYKLQEDRSEYINCMIFDSYFYFVPVSSSLMIIHIALDIFLLSTKLNVHHFLVAPKFLISPNKFFLHSKTNLLRQNLFFCRMKFSSSATLLCLRKGAKTWLSSNDSYLCKWEFTCTMVSCANWRLRKWKFACKTISFTD